MLTMPQALEDIVTNRPCVVRMSNYGSLSLWGLRALQRKRLCETAHETAADTM